MADTKMAGREGSPSDKSLGYSRPSLRDERRPQLVFDNEGLRPGLSGCAPFQPARRRGLAPLELVLSLPILLFVMALMINYGTVSSWKVRGWLAARHAVWQSRWPRNLGNFPRPEYWPTTANMGAGGSADVTELNHPAVDQPVARGPWLMNTQVDEDLLDPTRGMRRGSSNLTRSFPFLGGLGDYHLPTETQLLDNKWQFERLGLSWTRQRRIPVIYTFPQSDAGLANAYLQAALAIYYAPFRPDLFPLDRDDEFLEYSNRFGWGRGAPDFHPNLRNCCNCCGLTSPGDCCHNDSHVTFCCTDHAVAQALASELVDRIQGKVVKDDDGNVIQYIPCVAERMAQAFIHLYQNVIQELTNQMAAVPPPTPAEIAGMQAEIADLQAKIDTLTQYVQTLQNAAS
jgi:hypothetical protein